jgi:hypothetical protein
VNDCTQGLAATTTSAAISDFNAAGSQLSQADIESNDLDSALDQAESDA